VAVSDLDRAIRAARAGIDQREAPIRRQLRDAYRRAVDALSVDLELVTIQIRDARAAGEDVSPDWLRRQDRYRRLIADAEREFIRFTDDGLRILRHGQVAAVSGGAAEAWELMEAAGIDVGFGGRVNTTAVENLVSAYDPASPLRGVLDSYGTNGARVIEDALTQGVIAGTGPREIARQIRRQLLAGGTTARLDALTRTTMMDSFTRSLFEQYGSFGLKRWRWVAAHSTRTCLACLAMSGRTFSMDQPFMARHVNCRCVPSPYIAEAKIPFESGTDWLARQSAATQRQMIPSATAFDAFSAGTLTVKDFLGRKQSRKWGPSIYERSGREALRRAA